VTRHDAHFAPDKVLRQAASDYLGVIGQLSGGNRMPTNGAVVVVASTRFDHSGTVGGPNGGIAQLHTPAAGQEHCSAPQR
jgi:hypothetical protein